MRPAATVIDRAEERQVPILMTNSDTLTTVQRLESLVGQIQFGGARRERFEQFAEQHIDWSRLDERLGLQSRS